MKCSKPGMCDMNGCQLWRSPGQSFRLLQQGIRRVFLRIESVPFCCTIGAKTSLTQLAGRNYLPEPIGTRQGAKLRIIWYHMGKSRLNNAAFLLVKKFFIKGLYESYRTEIDG